MTTKQAINLLERISYSQHDAEKREALEMAVRALSSQQMDTDSQGLVKDCISRKMAIEAINNCYCGGEDSCGEPWIYEDDAIKAVEQLPSAQPTQTNADSTQTNALDCVSRQDAIDALDGFRCGTKAAWKVIEDLPSAQPHWIPCSERLPEDNVPVNITWINRKPEFYYAKIKDVPFTATGVYFKGKWYWYSSTVEDYLAEYGRAEWDEIEEAMHNSIEVVAWMPFPEPYRGESE